MNDLSKVTNQLEYLFLKRLARGLKEETIDIPRAKALAKEFLQIEPFSSVEDAKSKIDSFTRKDSYFLTLNEYIEAYYSEQQKNALIEKMRQHIKQGNIDQALEVAKN